MPPKRSKPLTPQEELLKLRLEQIKQLPISPKAKDYISKTLEANAADSQDEGLDFALKHISKDRLAIVTETAKKMRSIGQAVTARGRARLAAMSESEWDKLVDEAQKDNEK